MSKQGQNKKNSNSCILTVAGFDGTGGAGVSADIKISSFLGVPNVSAITSIVIQSPFEVMKKIDLMPAIIRDQIDILKKNFDIRIVNIGLLNNWEILEDIIQAFESAKIIFDPILASGSGKFQFFPTDQIEKIKPLLNRIFLITPNVPEAESLTGCGIQSKNDFEPAAVRLKEMGARNVLLKGGHLASGSCQDTLYYRGKFYTFSSSRRPFRIHGTGSFLNAAIAGYLFIGNPLLSSIKKARKLLESALQHADPDNPLLHI